MLCVRVCLAGEDEVDAVPVVCAGVLLGDSAPSETRLANFIGAQQSVRVLMGRSENMAAMRTERTHHEACLRLDRVGGRPLALDGVHTRKCRTVSPVVVRGLVKVAGEAHKVARRARFLHVVDEALYVSPTSLLGAFNDLLCSAKERRVVVRDVVHLVWLIRRVRQVCGEHPQGNRRVAHARRHVDVHTEAVH